MALAPFSGRCLAPPGGDMHPRGALCNGNSLPKALTPNWSGSSAPLSHPLAVAAHCAAAQPGSTSLHRTPCPVILNVETCRSPSSIAPNRQASSPASRPHAAAQDRFLESSILTSGVRAATTPRSAANSNGSIAASAPSAAQAAVEVLGPNSRRVSASIQVTAPLISVWSVLTDYYRLADYVPSLAKNEVLELREGGARLLQVGEQDVALGLKFQARVVVDVDEEPEQSVPVPGSTAQGAPVAASAVASEVSYTGLQGGATPAVGSGAEAQAQGQRQGQGSLLCRRAIRFIMREGDFASFTGRWVLESVQPGASSAASAALAPTRLSYSVDVTPHFWLPVALIEGRITREIGANLASVALEALKRASYAA